VYSKIVDGLSDNLIALNLLLTKFSNVNALSLKISSSILSVTAQANIKSSLSSYKNMFKRSKLEIIFGLDNYTANRKVMSKLVPNNINLKYKRKLPENLLRR
jgi:hypothetical protein